MATPMYRKIAEELREQIESGVLKPGQQVRTELELREHYQASRNTIRDAIKWLTNRGLVETRPGQGTFVARKIAPYVNTLTADPEKGSAEDRVLVLGPGEGETYQDEVKKQLRKPFKTEPQVGILKATHKVASRLEIPEGDAVVSRRQKRYIDGTLCSLETSFYPMEFVTRGAQRLIEAGDIDQGTVVYIAEVLGLRQVGYSDLITVRTPDATEAGAFNLPEDGRVAVYEVLRTAFDQAGTPTRLTVTVYPTDRNQFIVNVGKVPADRTVLAADSQDPPADQTDHPLTRLSHLLAHGGWVEARTHRGTHQLACPGLARAGAREADATREGNYRGPRYHPPIDRRGEHMAEWKRHGAVGKGMAG